MTECAICSEQIPDYYDACVLTCEHKFHVNCIQTWFMIKNNTCPLCRCQSVCQHGENSKVHLEPYLFDFIKQQKDTISELTKQMEELETRLFLTNEQQRQTLPFVFPSIPSAAFSFHNTENVRLAGMPRRRRRESGSDIGRENGRDIGRNVIVTVRRGSY